MSVRWLVGYSVCHYYLKGREATLACSYWCFILDYVVRLYVYMSVLCESKLVERLFLLISDCLGGRHTEEQDWTVGRQTAGDAETTPFKPRQTEGRKRSV